MSEENTSCESTQEDKTPGLFSWRELVTNDIAGSEKFYTELLGWTVDSVNMGDFTYNMFMKGERPVAGMIQPPMEEAKTSWINYITVDDLEATVAKAKELGATECMPITEISGKGRFAGFSDPQGACIAFWEYAK